jgi:hypothetical protein
MTPIKDQVFIIPEVKLSGKLILSGNCLKQLVIVVCQDNYGAVESELLSKMMKAIQYDLSEDVSLLEVDSKISISLSNLVSSWKDLILFGVNPEDVGMYIQYKPYQILSMEGKRVITADNLTIISGDASKKQLLWTLFQKMFLNK